MKSQFLVLVMLVIITVEAYGLNKGKMAMAGVGHEMIIKSTKLLGYFGGSTAIDNHHNIPRDQFGYAGHGTGQLPSGGEEGSNHGSGGDEING